MNRKELHTKLPGSLALLVWSAVVLSAFYITQRPQTFQLIRGIGATLWSIILTTILLLNSAGLGRRILEQMRLQLNAPERLLLGTGLGLGALGFAGYGLGAMGWANAPTLAIILFSILLWVGLTKAIRGIWADLVSLANDLKQSHNEVPRWIGPAVTITACLGFLFTFLPPAEGFDGLLYHLALPERLLADGRILPYDNIPFWYPSLVEGNYLWALGLGSEQTAQLTHLSFAMLAILLVWQWSRILFGNKAAWWTLAILISMPSLPWLSSWAYSDMALTFENLACLYAIWRWCDTRDNRWLLTAGIFAGLAMGIKYTSFILPLMSVILILFWERGTLARVRAVLQFSLPAGLATLPWYVRNWLIMGNPVYPFVFGGRYWDSFRAEWWSGSGTGIGWNLRELILMPFTITLGYRDQVFHDSRFGPLFLLFFPLAIWIIWRKRSARSSEREALLILTAFFGMNYIFWAFGVIQTEHLWQARYLWPGLIALSIPIGLGIAHLTELDLPRLRISFIAGGIIGLVIFMTLLDNGLSLIFRRPLAYALGMESRQSFYERMQPDYASALELVASTPADARIYFMFEPRSYGMTRAVQPDPINDNLMHDFHSFGTADNILSDWRARGYTHMLINFPHVRPSLKTADGRFDEQFDLLLGSLVLVAEQGDCRLYVIPN